MPRQNRMTPFGELIAVPDRGMFWGNRGSLHDAQGRLVRYSRGRAQRDRMSSKIIADRVGPRFRAG
jgi:hypothetical protein